MAEGFAVAALDDIVHPQWPYWAPIRHHFDVRSFGVNAWRGEPGEDVVKPHSEGPGGHEELYIVLGGSAHFEIAGESFDAPAGTVIHIGDPELQRSAKATASGTVVLSLGGWPEKPFTVSEWEQGSF